MRQADDAATEPDPQLGGLDEEVQRQKKIEEDLTRTVAERYKARITRQTIASCVYIMAGKVVAFVVVAVFALRSARRIVAATAAVGTAGTAVALTGLAYTTLDSDPQQPAPSALVNPAPHHRRSPSQAHASTLDSLMPAAANRPIRTIATAPTTSAGPAEEPPTVTPGQRTQASRTAAMPPRTTQAPTTTVKRATPIPTRTVAPPVIPPQPTRSTAPPLPTTPEQTHDRGGQLPVLPSLLPSLNLPVPSLPINLPSLLDGLLP